ncbi:hypothetical protein KCU98_g219, partial [Aureobasidium melanogenum]
MRESEGRSFYRDTPFDKPVETQSGSLQGTQHRASDYALDLVSERQMLTEVLLEFATLLLSQLCERRVGDVIFLCRMRQAWSSRGSLSGDDEMQLTSAKEAQLANAFEVERWLQASQQPTRVRGARNGGS